MKHLLITTFAAAAVTTVFAQDRSTDFPHKPIRFISISAPGSGGDTLVRMLAEKMSVTLKTPFVVENKPGAGGLIAVDTAAKAAPDGYTITIGGATTHVLLPVIHPKMPYNALQDFVYLGQVGTAPIVLLARSDVAANNVTDLIQLSKAQPGMQYASWGNGSSGHFCGELLNQRKGTGMQHIPYKSVNQITTDMYGGHIQLAYVDAASAVPMIKTGKVKALALCTARSSNFPGVRSYEDEGIDGGAGKRIAPFRWGVYAPAGTPAAVVNKLSAALKAAVESPEVEKKLLSLGITPAYLSGADVLELTVRDIEVWKQVAHSASIKLD